MKKSVKLFVIVSFILFSINEVSAQFTKNLKSYSINGFEVRKGSKFKVLPTIIDNKDQALWTYYSMKRVPAPKKHFNKKNVGIVYTVEKVVKLKGLADESVSVLIMFKENGKKCYSHLIKAIKEKEILIIN